MTDKLSSLLKALSHLSIPVVLGTLATSWFFASLAGIQHPWHFYEILTSSTWLIFTFDHLMDSRGKNPDVLSPRHRFHYKYQNILMKVSWFILIFNMTTLVLTYQDYYLVWGLTGLIFIVLYFLIIRFVPVAFVIKEWLVAFGAVYGMCLLPAGPDLAVSHPHILAIAGIFFLLNLTNIFTLSRLDIRADKLSGMTSAGTMLGYTRLSQLVFNLIFMVFVALLIWAFYGPLDLRIPVAIIVFSMLHVLTYLNIRFHVMKRNPNFRTIADSIYILPALIWWLYNLTN